MLHSQNQSTIMRLRVKSTTLDPLTAQQRLASTLNTLSLRPASLTPSAILCVRTFRDPRPGSLRLRQPDTGATLAWEQAVNHALDQFARQAARPIEGAVPANAEAVIFADRSELLACLAADWCAGVVRAQWWWQSLLRNDDITRAVIDAWLTMPEYIPLALQRLAARQQTIAFVQQLNDDHTRLLLRALVQTFGLYELSIRLAEIIELEPEGRDVIAQHSTRTASVLPVQALPVPPWQPWVQTHVEHLSPDRQVLLGVGLMLHAAPSIVRSAPFASEMTAWHTAIRIVPTQQHALAEAMPVSPSAPAPTATVESTPAPQTQAEFSTLAVQPEKSPDAEPSLREMPFATKQSPPEQRDKPIAHEIVARPSIGPSTAAAPLGTRDVTEAEQALIEIETEFGGVCYFINLGLFLNLYGDFTTPLQPGLDLPIWDFMALVAQELIGNDVTHDSIWALLAQLADRSEDELPGTHFDPTHNVIASPAGAKQSPSLPAEIASSQTSLTCPAPSSGVAMTPLEFWLADLMSITRPRLQLALGVSADELPRYFKQHARIVVSAVNFDAYFALADLPIEIRLSGLDRDPGWVPAAGRTVRFHYD